MKSIFTLLLLGLGMTVFSQTELFFSDPIPVVPADNLGYRAPRIAVLADGNPIVYWGRTGSPHRMYVAKWGGDSFLPPLEINTNGIEVDLWGGGLGPQLAVAGNTVFIVFETYGEGIWCIRSTDGGESFSNPVSVYELPPGRVATLPGLTVDPDGNPVVSFVTTNQQEMEARYEIAVSSDGGLSFEPAVVANLAAADEVCECCPAALNIPTSEEILLIYRNNDNNIRDIWASKSTDGGLTFPIATDLDDTDWETFICPSSGPHAMLFGDSLITTYYSVGEGTASVYFSTMQINTMEKGRQVKIPTWTGENLGQNFPRVAGNQDTIAIIYEESGEASKDVIMTFSINGTADLTQQTVKVADEMFMSERYPDFAFSNGVFHIVYESPSTGKVMYRQASFSSLTHHSEIAAAGFVVNIFPNPFSEVLTVDFKNPSGDQVNLELLDLNGRSLWLQKTTDTNIEIENENLLPGVYFLNIISGKHAKTLRLVKMK